MPIIADYVCQCQRCRQNGDSDDSGNSLEKKLHYQINLLMSRLDEQQRRWFAALEANRIGHGGVCLVSQITGLDEKTIHRGQLELEAGLEGRPSQRVRLPGGGRPGRENPNKEVLVIECESSS
jgi:hypothetical protein